MKIKYSPIGGDTHKRGRPFAGTEHVNCSLPVALLEQLDTWRASERPIPSRPAAIRRILEERFK